MTILYFIHKRNLIDLRRQLALALKYCGCEWTMTM